MSFWRLLWIVSTILAACMIGMAQAPAPVAASLPGTPTYQRPTPPPLPYDALELVTGNAQQIQDADQRAAALTLLTNARALSNVRAQPYDLKTTVKTFGSLPSDGNWILEDISPARNIYRWTAQGPSYSAIYLYNDKLLSSNQAAEAIPLRLMQVRDAIFFVFPWTGQYTSMRAADGYLHGVALRCFLIGQGIGGRTFQGGRNWEESEYCIDPKSGLLASYSPVPGLYIQYDYTNAVHFHEKIIPEGFTISEAGRIVIEAKTESVTDSAAADNRIFNPSGLHALGVGSIMQPAIRVRTGIYPPPHHVILNGSGPMPTAAILGATNSAPTDANATMQVVVVHGAVSPDGQIGETEILASTNASLNQAALDRAKGWNSMIVRRDAQPGTTPQSREIIFTLEATNPPM